MKKIIIGMLCAVLMAALLAPGVAANKPVKHKAKVADKGYAGQSDTEKGLNTSARKTSNFTKKTLTVPQHHPNSRHKPHNRQKSTLVRGTHHSAHKVTKFVKKTFSSPHNK